MKTSLLKRQSNALDHDDWKKDRRYGILIDAGSSGSRIYVYSWKNHEHMKASLSSDDLKGRIPVVERGDEHGLKWTQRTEPGISTYGSRPGDVGEHLESLLEFAKEVIPVESHLSTPVFLMATAGMRLLPDHDQQALLGSACEFIQSKYPFFMSSCDSHIQVIPGELEGVYGWVAVNYLMGGFDASIRAYLEPQKKPIEQHHTFGFLDMGGASAQIAFEPEHHQRDEHISDLTKVHLRTLDGRQVEYDVFVATFLGYGSAEVRRRYLEEQIKTAYTEANGKHLLDENHMLHLDDPCLPLNLSLVDSSTSVSLKLRGTGRFSQCLELTTGLLNKNAECPTKPCLFNGVHTPNIDWSVNKFIGVSEYWYSSHDILGLGGVYDFQEYEKKSADYCSRDWNLLLQEKADLDPIELHRYQLQCFKSAWIVNVLHEGIEIPRITDPGGHNNPAEDRAILEQSIESVGNKNWNPPFQSIDSINDIQVSWTLGAMLLHVANQIPLVDHPDQRPGHSTDDEGAHQIADGVELPAHVGDHGVTGGKQPGGLIDAIQKSSSTGIVAIIIFVLAVLLCLYIGTKKLWRRDHAYRHVDGANGGILGNEPITTRRPRFSPSAWARSTSSALSQVSLALRHWTSNILRGYRAHYPRASTFEEDDAGVVSINMGERLVQSHPLNPPTKSRNQVFKEYMRKKRYSGDSHDLSKILPLGSQSSALVRTDSASNLTSRIGSSPNLDGLNAPIERSSSPLQESGTLMSRTRSRIRFAINELSDEDEHAASDSQVLASPNRSLSSSPAPPPPSTPPASGHAWIPHRKGSPRGSLDESTR